MGSFRCDSIGGPMSSLKLATSCVIRSVGLREEAACH